MTRRLWKVAASLIAALLLTMFAASMPAVANASQVVMYRLYNPNSGEHFYTADVAERNNVYNAGWNYEGVGWYAPSSGTPVFRLYNANGGEHHYTMDAAERDALVRAGWSYEGQGWNSDPAQGVPLYREYNPNAFSCNHNYTTNQNENNSLVSLGWRDEGIGWYGVTPDGSAVPDTSIAVGGHPTNGGGSSASNPVTGEVYWTPNGRRYHSTRDCPSLANSRRIYSGAVAEAGSRTPCHICCR